MTTKTETRKKTVLHVGSGPTSVFSEESYGGRVAKLLTPADWDEIRIDLSPEFEPDIVADALDLPFEDESADAVVCLACLEHLHEWNAAKALQEFHRVLKKDGQLILSVPDLELAAKMILDNKVCEVLYESDAGPVRALDLIYGHQLMVPGHPLMAHHTGWTANSLASWLWEVGFDGRIDRNNSDLWAQVTKVKEHKDGGEKVGFCFYQRSRTLD